MSQDVLVIGGGIAGMQAALDLANSGYYVYLVEQGPSIGGKMAQLDKTFPTNDCTMWIISPKLVEVGRHLNIELHTLSEIKSISGESGNFEVTLQKTPRYIDPEKCTACGDCADVCPVLRPSRFDVNLTDRKAAYKLYAQAIPGSFAIEKRDTAPCRMGCPAHLNVQGYVAMVKMGKYREAVEIIMQDLPFPGILGRICPHKCEKSCRRLEVDEAISIRELKRVAADHVDLSDIPVPKTDPKEERVAVIGSGPAGLTAAYFMALDGYPVDVYESMPEAGGMMRYGIPEHRLPRSVIDAEIDNLKRYGINIHTNSTVGKDVTLKELEAHGAKAIFLAIGAWKGLKLRIPGEDAAYGVSDVTTFLREVHLKNLTEVKGKVVVIGGGHSALDAARVSLRLGADEAHIIYRRGREEMLAEPEEVEEAEKEGIKIHFLVAPVSISDENGKVSGIECIRTRLTEPDATGRRKPVPVEGSNFFIEADHIIPAIGQTPDFDVLGEAHGLDIGKWGMLTVNPETLQTNVPHIFAGGDAVTGPATVIEAVEMGKRAAKYMAAYLKGEELPTEWEEGAPMGENWTEIADRTVKPRMKIPTLPTEKRLSGFDEVNLAPDEETARAEAARCVDCGGCCECYQCVTACKAEAVTIETHMEQSRDVSLNVGSVILAPGFEAFDPSSLDTYSYTRFSNVITALELERILSATGPYQGHLIRPSDSAEPKKIAWLQCIGSRDINRCDMPYCSSVCCMYAIKEAVIAKEHTGPDLETSIFFMDIRTYGKDFEKYYDRARDEKGVRFVRARIHTIEEDKDTNNLILRYTDEDGKVQIETYDMVVLSVGMKISRETADLATRLGAELDHDNFVRTGSFAPVATSREGIYVCGVFQEPKDIPYSVMEASAAACEAKVNLPEGPSDRVREKIYPNEKDVSDETPHIGVFVCNCGINIGGIVDVPKVAEYARTIPGVTYVGENLFTCSQDSQEKMKEVIQTEGLNRIVVAACTPRTHEELFQETLKDVGMNKYLFEMANIRNQCSWVHSQDKAAATEKAKDLIRMAVARAQLIQPLPQPSIPVDNKALVIGGGLSGMTAALGLADQGYHTYLVEQSDTLGGNARRLLKTFRGEDIADHLEEMVQSVGNHPDIEVFTGSQVTSAEGFVGNFETTISGNGNDVILKHGAIVVATGGREYEPAEYLYGQDARVLTHLELDDAIRKNGETIAGAETAVFIQCVGSREPERPYCSKICCTHTMKSAIRLKENNPEMNIYVLYRDIRTYGQRETLYKEARKLGIIFIRYERDQKPKIEKGDGDLVVAANDPVLGRDLVIRTDLLVLATGIVPHDQSGLAQLYKLSLNEDGFFMEAHAKLRPVDFVTEGIFMAGLAHYPKPIEESIAQAKAAAARASVILSKKQITVEGTVSHIDEAMCRGCGECVEACPFGAVSLEDREGGRNVAVSREALCKGCGACAVACPTGAASVYHYGDEAVLTMVETALS